MEDNKVAVILEDLKSQFRTFGKGQEALSEKVVTLTEGQGALTERVDNLATGQKALIEKVAVLVEDMTIVKDELASINSKLSRKVDVEDFEKLEKRVNRLESLVIIPK